jgi:hypothetical protein
MTNPQQSLDQIKAQIESLKQQLGGKDGINVVNITDLATAQTLLRGLQDEAADLASSFGDMASTLANIVGELSKSDTATKSATKAYKGLVSIAQKMQYEEEGIYAYNVKQLDNLHSQAKAQKVNLERSIARLTPAEKITDEGKALLKALDDQYAIENDLIKAIEKRLELEKKVEKTFGATGALIEGSSKLLSTMGFGHLSSELSELGDKLKAELRDKLKESGDEADRIGLSFKFMAKGLAGSAKIFADGLTDPLFLVGKIFDTYLEINKASVDVQRLTGQNAVTLSSWNTGLATSKDILETISELTKQTGRNAQNIFSEDVLVQAAELKTTMGLTAEEAGGIAVMAQTSGKSVEDMTDSIVATTSAFNGANRSAVSQGQILRDVATTADSIKLSLGNNDVAIAKAASAARRLGMDLGRVDQIAGSLMNFEDSIGKELEAELLIGKELNLEKARELALNNDLAGLSDELFKNSADIAEFGKMNRIQQEAYAASLGMTKDELAKIAYQKALDNNMTAEQAALAAGVNAEEMKRVDAQQNFANALNKIAGALAPILDLVGKLLSIPLAPYILLGVGALYKFGSGLKDTLRTMGSLARSTKDFFSNFNAKKAIMDFFGGLKDKFGDLKDKFKELKGAFGEGFAGKIKEKAADAGGGITEKLSDKAQEKVGEKAEGLADKALGAGKEVPEKTGGGMSSLTESIQKIKPTQILAGAAALVLVAGAVFIFAKAAQEFATVSWEDMAKAGVGLLGLVAALAAVGAIMMSGVGALAILAGAAAIVIMAGGLFILGKALQEVGEGMQMMEPALSLVASIGDKAIGLMTVGASLMGIAAGLREIASAGTGAIPVLDKINTLAGGGNKSVGGAKGKEEGTMASLEAKFDTLIALVKQGTTINLDGTKIATSVNRNLPRVQTASS